MSKKRARQILRSYRQGKYRFSSFKPMMTQKQYNTYERSFNGYLAKRGIKSTWI
jgi:hypothetical protein